MIALTVAALLVSTPGCHIIQIDVNIAKLVFDKIDDENSMHKCISAPPIRMRVERCRGVPHRETTIGANRCWKRTSRDKFPTMKCEWMNASRVIILEQQIMTRNCLQQRSLALWGSTTLRASLPSRICCQWARWTKSSSHLTCPISNDLNYHVYTIVYKMGVQCAPS